MHTRTAVLCALTAHYMLIVVGDRSVESSGFSKESGTMYDYNVDSGACFKVLEEHQFTVPLD